MRIEKERVKGELVLGCGAGRVAVRLFWTYRVVSRRAAQNRRNKHATDTSGIGYEEKKNVS